MWVFAIGAEILGLKRLVQRILSDCLLHEVSIEKI